LKLAISTVLLAAALALAGCTGAGTPTATPTDSTPFPLATLAVGDCTGPVEVQGSATLLPVACAQEHNWEVAAVLTPTGEAYPGEDALRQLAESDCAKAFTDYVGVAPDYSPLGATFVAPSQTHWADPANRHIACLIGSADGGLTGSLKHTALSFPTVGQCIGKPSANSFALDLIDCSAAHFYQVYAAKKWTGTTAPTPAEFDKFYTTVCVAGFKSFVGIDAGKSKYEILYFIAPAKLWTKVHDHRLVCAAGSPKGKISGSLKDSKE
jgi:hypothetical protein